MMNKNIEEKIKIITHSGSFHVDDIFAVATVILTLDGKPYEIIRTRDMEIVSKGDFIVDVGGEYNSEKKIFDHHQQGGAGERENGIPYSSFGLVWKEFGEKLCGAKEMVDIIDAKIVSSIDASDNGVETYESKNNMRPYLIHSLFSVFQPTWKESEMGKTNDEVFLELVQLAKKILEREIIVARDFLEGKEIVEDVFRNLEEGSFAIVEGQYPWEDVVIDYPNVLFVVKPDGHKASEWKVRAVRSDPYNSFENRKDLPKKWAGKRGKELVDISGVPDALFCHNKRFIAVAGSKEGAVAMAKLAIQNDNE